MAGESTSVHTDSVRPGGPSAADLIDQLMHFEGPPAAFLAQLLAVQCRLARTTGAVVLGPGPDGTGQVLAMAPPLAEGQNPPPWVGAVASAAQNAATQGVTVVKPLRGASDMYGQPAGRHVIVIPVRRGGQAAGAVAGYLIETGQPDALAAAQERLELTISLLSLYEARLTLQARQGDLGRLRMAAEVLSTVNEHDDFAGAAMTLCNEVTTRWGCDRTSLGFLKGRYVHLKALSNTEKFSRKMKLVQDIEGAMEECLDQDVEVVHPAAQQATFVSRAAADLGGRHGPTSVLSLPLRREGKPVAVLTVERPAEKPFELAEAEALRLTCDLCTPRVAALHARDRWFGARAAAGVRKGLALLLGAKHTWIKLIILAVIGAAVFLTFAEGDYNAEAPFELQAVSSRVVNAPFKGRLDKAYVEPDDPIVGTGDRAPNWLLDPKHVTDAAALAEAIATGAEQGAQPSKHIAALLTQAGEGGLRHKLNVLLAGETFAPPLWGYAENPWRQITLTARQKDLLDQRAKAPLAAARLAELNRSLLAAAYPAYVKPGPTVLATLKTDELRMQLASKRAELAGHVKQKQAAQAAVEDPTQRGKQADVEIAQAKIEEVTADINLLELYITNAVIVSAIDGYVAQGDLKRQLGAPVEEGDVLFEIVGSKEMRGELSVPEDLIADVREAQARAEARDKTAGGEMAATAMPESRFAFEIERINPVAEVVDQKNVFKVRVCIKDLPSVLRSPGMKGVARIRIDRRSYGYIYTRKLINWIRMKFWL